MEGGDPVNLAKSILLAGLVTFSGLAAAHNCPNEMKQIDAALKVSKLEASKLEEVKKLRADGEAKHAAGDHNGSMAVLKKAKATLGI
jgi:Tfp pilus assembly protein FimT